VNPPSAYLICCGKAYFYIPGSERREPPSLTYLLNKALFKRRVMGKRVPHAFKEHVMWRNSQK
jgi:hypothetical protein